MELSSRNGIYIYIYININRQNLEKVQLEYEIRIQFCIMCLNLYGNHSIIIYILKFVLYVHLSFLIFVLSELMSAKY